MSRGCYAASAVGSGAGVVIFAGGRAPVVCAGRQLSQRIRRVRWMVRMIEPSKIKGAKASVGIAT